MMKITCRSGIWWQRLTTRSGPRTFMLTAVMRSSSNRTEAAELKTTDTCSHSKRRLDADRPSSASVTSPSTATNLLSAAQFWRRISSKICPTQQSSRTLTLFYSFKLDLVKYITLKWIKMIILKSISLSSN